MSLYNNMTEDERRRNYENDVYYEVWRSGRDPDRINYDRVQENYYSGHTSEEAAAEEIRAQRQFEQRRMEQRMEEQIEQEIERQRYEEFLNQEQPPESQ